MRLLFSFFFRLILIAAGVIAAVVWWQQGQLTVLALQRIDPVPEVKALLDQDQLAQAADYLDFFWQYEYVQNDSAAQNLRTEIDAVRSSTRYQLSKLAEGVMQGSSDETIGQVAAVASDFLVVGDLRDLIIQGWRYSRDEETDPVLVALASLGVAATTLQIASSMAAVPSAGATAPVTAGVTTAKSGITTLKTLRRLNQLPDWIGNTLIASARKMRSQRSLTEMESLQQLYGDVATLARVPGGPRLLAASTDAQSLARAAQFSKAYGKNTSALYRIGGRQLVDNTRLTQAYGAQAVQLAATYGQRGLRALDQTGAIRFAKYSARASKIAWKGDIFRLLAGWLSDLPNVVLAVFVLLGLLALTPKRKRRLRAKLRV